MSQSKDSSIMRILNDGWNELVGTIKGDTNIQPLISSHKSSITEHTEEKKNVPVIDDVEKILPITCDGGKISDGLVAWEKKRQKKRSHG